MSSFASGPPDEVVRVRWINEFEDQAKGLPGAMRRSAREYQKAVADQKKNDAIAIKSGRDAAREAMASHKARMAELRELQHLESSEGRIHANIADLAKKRADVEEKIAARDARVKAKTAQIHQDTADKIKRTQIKSQDDRLKLDELYTARVDRIQRSLNAKKRKWERIDTLATRAYERERAKIQRDFADQRIGVSVEERNAITEAERKKLADFKATHRLVMQQRHKGADAELRLLQEFLTKSQRFRTAALKRDTKERERALEDLKKNLIAERDLLVAEAQRKAVVPRERDVLQIGRIDDQLVLLESDLKELDRLRRRFPDDDSRNIVNRLRLLDVQMRQFRKQVGLIQQEAIQMGHITSERFEELEFHARQAGLSGREFGDEMRRMGMEVRRFGAEKQREIVFLRENTTQLGRHQRASGFAGRTLRGLATVLRFTTNEMIIFNQTMRILRIPFFLSMIELAIRAVNTLAGGIAVLVSALAPLAGQLAAIGPLALGAAQAMTVWKIATDNLGKSANDLSKIITTALTGNAEDFQKLMEQLPRQAKEFALEIRSLAPGFRAFREELSARIFSGLTEGLSGALPTIRRLRDEFVDTASIMGRGFARLGQMIGSAEWAADLQRIAQNTNRWLAAVGPGVRDLAVSFKNLAVSAAPLVDHLVALTNRFGAWLRNLTESGRRSGALTNFWRESNFVLDRTLEILGRFGRALINIGRIAYRVLGRQVLKDLAAAADRFREWTESATGRNRIAQYFRDLRGPLYEAARLFRDLVKAFFQIGDQKGFEDTLRTLRTETLPAIVEMLRNMQKTFTPAFLNLLKELVEFVTTLTGEAGPLTKMVSVFARFIGVLNDFIKAHPLLQKVLLTIITFTVIFRTARFAAAISGIGLAARGIVAIGSAATRSATQVGLLNRALSSLNLVHRAVPAAVPVGGPGTTGFGAFGTLGVAGRQTIPERARGFIGRQAGAIGAGAGLAAAVGGGMLGGRAGTILSMAGTGALIGAPFGGVGAVVGAGAGAAAGAALTLFTKRTNEAAEALKRIIAIPSGRFREARRREREARELLPEARLGVRQARQDVITSRQRMRELRRAGADTHTLAQAQLDLDAANLRLAQSIKLVNRLERQLTEARARQVSVIENTTKRIVNRAGELRKTLRGSFQGVGVETMTNRLDMLAENFKKLKPEFADRLRQLRDFIKAIGEIPSAVTIEMILSPRLGPPAPKQMSAEQIKKNLRPLTDPRGFAFNALPKSVRDALNNARGRGTGDGDGTGGGGGPAEIDTQQQLLIFQKVIENMALKPLLALRKRMEETADRMRARIRSGAASQRLRDQLAVVEDKLSELDTAIGERLTRITDMISRTVDAINRQFERATQRLTIQGIDPSSAGGQTFLRAAMGRQRRGIVEQIQKLQKARREMIAAGLPKEDIQTLTDQILALSDQARGLFADIKQAGRDIREARFQKRFGTGEFRLRKLELEQQIAGTFETGGGARAALIRGVLIPLLEERRSQLKGEKNRARREELTLQILELQLEAQNAIKENTDQIQKNTGNLSFEFQGQRFSDSFALGVGV